MTELFLAPTRVVPEKMTQSGAWLALRAGDTSGPVILIDGGDHVGHACSRAVR